MLKMLGAACVIFSASAVGFGFSGNVRRQCAQLTALIEALTYLKSEMLYRRTPLPQALETATALTDDSICRSMLHDTPRRFGVDFEGALPQYLRRVEKIFR